MNSGPTQKLAVLIDADNAQPSIIEGLLAEIAKYGTANVKRIYGDWTGTHLKGWKDVLLKHSIQPIQQFRYTIGKNATDSAMIIDAMDLLFTNKFDGFCIVSSDSDFTKIASRLRESGLVVYGFGEKKTPEPFVSACDKFIYTEVLISKEDDNLSIKRKSANELKQDTKLVNLLRNAVEASSDESGWSHLAPVGNNIAKQVPDFDPRNYGYKKLGELVAATKLFEIEERLVGDGQSKAVYIKDKRKQVY
ncbi:MAG: NYN domain-containing protein [Thermodesulfovibrionales bacterium]